MKITHYPFTQIRNQKGKSFGLFIVMTLFVVLTLSIWFIYKNIVGILTHYTSYDSIDPKQITFRSNDNIMTMLSKSTGISEADTAKIIRDPHLAKPEIYTLVPYPVMGKFSLFSFDLETDIPVFAYSGTSLQGTDIGISQKMLDYYNLQFANTAPVFPVIDKFFLRGQKIRITVGASKLFQLSGKNATPFEGSITRVDSTYPGFGLVIPEKILKEKLNSIGRRLGNPYRITATMKSLDDKSYIANKYKHLNVAFQSDKIKNIQEKIMLIRNICAAFFVIVGGIIFILLLYILSGIFRESSHIYRMLAIFSRKSFSTKILTLGTPIILILTGSICGLVLSIIGENFIAHFLMGIFEQKGITYSILLLNFQEIFWIFAINLALFGIILLFFEFKYSREVR